MCYDIDGRKHLANFSSTEKPQQENWNQLQGKKKQPRSQINVLMAHCWFHARRVSTISASLLCLVMMIYRKLEKNE